MRVILKPNVHRYTILPRQSHTGIVHSVADIVLNLSRKLIASATRSKCTLLSELLSECAVIYCIYKFWLNHLYGCKHHKRYTENVHLCANFIQDARMNPAMNKHLDSDIYLLYVYSLNSFSLSLLKLHISCIVYCSSYWIIIIIIIDSILGI